MIRKNGNPHISQPINHDVVLALRLKNSASFLLLYKPASDRHPTRFCTLPFILQPDDGSFNQNDFADNSGDHYVAKRLIDFSPLITTFSDCSYFLPVSLPQTDGVSGTTMIIT